ncbi:MAG: hypothetical protein UH239_05940 [Acutalibacteraceae bacterium]|nr:hypothetical protein [Acutalibacteraceae bacterium]
MKEKYIKEILENESTLRTMFSLVWDDRERCIPEKSHPEWIAKAEPAYDRICKGESKDFYLDIWDMVKCLCETYYIIGLRQAFEASPVLLPVSSVIDNPFAQSK